MLKLACDKNYTTLSLFTCNADRQDNGISCEVCLLPISVACVHATGSANLRVHGHISHQLPARNLATLLLDQVHQGCEDALADGTLTLADVKDVLVCQSCTL